MIRLRVLQLFYEFDSQAYIYEGSKWLVLEGFRLSKFSVKPYSPLLRSFVLMFSYRNISPPLQYVQDKIEPHMGANVCLIYIVLIFETKVWESSNRITKMISCFLLWVYQISIALLELGGFYIFTGFSFQSYFTSISLNSKIYPTLKLKMSWIICENILIFFIVTTQTTLIMKYQLTPSRLL